MNLFIAILALSLHELGHYAAARALGLRVKRIGCNFRGVFIVREEGTPVSNALVTIAGPFLNIALAALFISQFHMFGLANLVLGFVNLLPFPHSDGARLLTVVADVCKPSQEGVH